MDEIKTICYKMQQLDQNGTWDELPQEWDDMSEIERFNELGYIVSTVNDWITEGVTEPHRHIINNVLDMIGELEIGIQI